LGGCSGGGGGRVAALAAAAAAQSSLPTITVKEAWARATPGGAATGVAYLTLTNNGTADDRLVGASTPVASEAQLHTTVMTNGVMQMRPLPALDLKPGATVALKPGGMHLMLMGLRQPLTEGQSFPLILTFEKAGPIETSVKIAKAGAMSGMDMGGTDMGGTGMKGMNMGGTSTR
jgi:periplasmic copper chaperone A